MPKSCPIWHISASRSCAGASLHSCGPPDRAAALGIDARSRTRLLASTTQRSADQGQPISDVLSRLAAPWSGPAVLTSGLHRAALGHWPSRRERPRAALRRLAPTLLASVELLAPINGGSRRSQLVRERGVVAEYARAVCAACSLTEACSRPTDASVPTNEKACARRHCSRLTPAVRLDRCAQQVRRDRRRRDAAFLATGGTAKCGQAPVEPADVVHLRRHHRAVGDRRHHRGRPRRQGQQRQGQHVECRCAERRHERGGVRGRIGVCFGGAGRRARHAGRRRLDGHLDGRHADVPLCVQAMVGSTERQTTIRTAATGCQRRSTTRPELRMMSRR